MNIQDYALDIGKSVDEVLEKMKNLKLITNDPNRLLSDDEVILLDNAFQDEEDYVQDEVVEDIALSMKAEQIAYDNNSYNKENKRTVKKNKNSKQSTSKFKEERKKLYKHREKLQSNEALKDDSVLLYKEGMTVSDLADALGVGSSEVIKKLMGLGILANVNKALSFDDVEVLALEFNKSVKKEETQDISNFENYELVDNEEDLVASIKFYNDTVVDFNKLIVSFPSNIIRLIFRYKRKEFYNHEKREIYEILKDEEKVK